MTPVFDESGHATIAGEVVVFYFTQETGEYVGWSEEYIPVGVSIPGNSTLIEPGDPITGFAWVFDGINWSSIEDHRGETVYNSITGEEVVINDIGPYPEGTSTQKPPIPNSEMRRAALSELSVAYQYDITQLNISWLAAAVSDGVNETIKKDAVIAQINDRKIKYTADRAAIISQYPE